jgi:hypothetical protein
MYSLLDEIYYLEVTFHCIGFEAIKREGFEESRVGGK